MFFDTIEEEERSMAKPITPPYPAEAVIRGESFTRELLNRLQKEHLRLPDDALEIVSIASWGLPNRMPGKLFELIRRSPGLRAEAIIRKWVQAEYLDDHAAIVRRATFYLQNVGWTPITHKEAALYNDDKKGNVFPMRLAPYRNASKFRSLLRDPSRPARSEFEQKMVDLAILIYVAGARASGMLWTNHLPTKGDPPLPGTPGTVYERPDRTFWLKRRTGRPAATDPKPHSI